jgi:hypothetical protein
MKPTVSFTLTTSVHRAAADNRTLLEQSRREGARPIEIAIFRNDSDSVVAPPQTVAAQLRPLHARAMAMRSGQHKFADYAANGTVRDAFRFVIDALGWTSLGHCPDRACRAPPWE